MRARTNPELDGYQFTVRRLSPDEGGGYLVEYPDIPVMHVRRRDHQRGDRERQRSATRLRGSIPGIGPEAAEAQHRGRSMVQRLPREK